MTGRKVKLELEVMTEDELKLWLPLRNIPTYIHQISHVVRILTSSSILLDDNFTLDVQSYTDNDLEGRKLKPENLHSQKVLTQ